MTYSLLLLAVREVFIDQGIKIKTCLGAAEGFFTGSRALSEVKYKVFSE